MPITPILAPALHASAEASRALLLGVAPAAVVLAVVLVLITAAAVVALVVEVRRDGYGLERPRPISSRFPWQTEPIARRGRMTRRRLSWRFLTASRTVHR